MDYDIGIVRRRRIISPDDCYFGVPTFSVSPGTTWDPSQKTASTVLSNGNLTATLVTDFAHDLGTRSIGTISGSDKKYFELHLDSVAGVRWQSGFCDSTYTLGTSLINIANAVGFREDGQLNYNGSSISSIGVTGTGDVMALAIDFGNKKIWARANNGNWNNSGTADPATNTGGLDITGIGSPCYAAVYGIDNLEFTTVRFSSSDWTLSNIPAGFSQIT